MNKNTNRRNSYGIALLLTVCLIMVGCGNNNVKKEESKDVVLKERQITFGDRTHDLDNNDNFSPDRRFLCYDTRGNVYNDNLANCKSIEKVEIATGSITVLWEPPSVSGENAAPGVAAASYHPTENKVIFIHGPFLEEVEERGYYDIKNRTGKTVSGDGKGVLIDVDMRDATTNSPTVPGAHRGGTHRHEYSRNGKRVGFTYDDYIQQDYARSIGYFDESEKTPEGYTHYFAVLLKPAKEGESKPGEIEKAYSDSWVDFEGTQRAFIGKVRAENGVDYETSLFVADISDDVDIATSYSGDKDTYPEPPKGIKIRRLTHSTTDDGVVRGSYDGKQIAYFSEDKNGIIQIFVIPTDGSDLSDNKALHPKQVTNFSSDASYIRWHPSDDYVFSISDGQVYANYVGSDDGFGKEYQLTFEEKERTKLVVSPDGNMVAYNIEVPAIVVKKGWKDTFRHIFVLELDKRFALKK